MKILITGISGLLGSNLAYYFKEKAEIIGIFHTHPVSIKHVSALGLDLKDFDKTKNIIQSHNPDVVIHCASRTDVDNMEQDHEGAWKANVLTTKALLDALQESNSKLVYISTDSVYPGTGGPHNEKGLTSPCNFYGKTKLEGETLVNNTSDSLILRTNIFGWNIIDKKSIAEWFLSNLQEKRLMKGFTDVYFSSIYTLSLAELIDECLKKNLSGIFNCACQDSMTKFQFGQRLADIFGLDQSLIEPITLNEAKLNAPRGKDLRLDVNRLSEVLDQKIPSMENCLQRFHSDWCNDLPLKMKTLS